MRFPVRRRGWILPLQLLIPIVVVCAMASLGGLLMSQGWQIARGLMLTSASDAIDTMGVLINEKLGRVVAPASATLRHLAQDPLAGAQSLPQRLERLPVLVGALRHLRFVSAIYAGYPDGEFFLVRSLGEGVDWGGANPPPGAAFLVQSIQREDGRSLGEWRFYDDGLRLLRQDRVETAFDPRERPWFRNAQAGGPQSMTRPYVFYTTGQTGITMSLGDRSGGPIIGLDIALFDLNAELRGLRPTPHAEFAVLDGDGMVLAHPEIGGAARPDGGHTAIQPLSTLHVAPLTSLAAMSAEAGRTVAYSVGGETWFGTRIPLDALPGHELTLLVATPEDDLLGQVRRGLARQLWLTLALTGALLLLGWLAGRRLGLTLTRLTQQAQQLMRFDFRQLPSTGGVVREIRVLEAVVRSVCVTIQNFLNTTEAIRAEAELERILQMVLDRMVETMGCDFGAVYLVEEEETAQLRLASIADPDTVSGRAQPSLERVKYGLAERLPMPSPEGQPPVFGRLAPDASQLAIILRDRMQSPLGLLVLNHPNDEFHAGDEFRAFAEKLSGALAIAIETRRLIDAQAALLDSIARVLAHAIDAKSPYTAGHCERVPQIATMIVDRMTEETNGPYSGFRLTREERHAFQMAAWLHDCGKITTPEHVIDKATKLETVTNRIHEIRTRFEILWRDVEIEHLRRLLAGEDAVLSEARLLAERQRLREEFTFVAHCNTDVDGMPEDAVGRLRQIAAQSWMRHFDDRLGLSREEARRLAELPHAVLPTLEPLLADRPEHVALWGDRRPPVERDDPGNVCGFDMALPEHQANKGELHNLSVRHGTLTEEERFTVNNHIVQTYLMLRRLPWPAHLRQVPEIAATHHERMDGLGYPRRLGAGQLSVLDRVMALADVFEALTAPDRPYKPARTLSESLGMMAVMSSERHLDVQVFRYFLHSGLWRTYAESFLRAAQIDSVDVTALEAQLAGSVRDPAISTSG